MLRRSLPPVTALFLLCPAIAYAGGPDADLPLGFPITDPSWSPTAIGVGYDDDAIPAYNTPTVLFTNFDGAQLNSGCGNNSKNDCSTLGSNFGWQILPFSGTHSDRAAIAQALREDVYDFGVLVSGERPPSSQDYAMVMVGNGASGNPSFAGVAPFIDCGNSNPNVTSFALEIGGANSMATVINQEAAHTWGLEHVNDPSDNLHPVAGGYPDPKYNDVCNKIVSNTDLDPSNGQCNSVHTNFCNSGYQNSYQEMLLLFGPTIPDDTAPTVVIDNPKEGDALPCPAKFDLTFTLSDDRKPQVFKTTIFLDDMDVQSGAYVDTTLKFPINGGLDPGSHTWRIETQDEWGNPAQDEVTFTIAEDPNNPKCSEGGGTTDPTTTGGSSSGGSTGGGTTGETTDGGSTTGAPETTGSDSGGPPPTTTGLPTTGGTGENADESGCACRADQRGGTALAALPMLLALVWRRRR